MNENPTPDSDAQRAANALSRIRFIAFGDRDPAEAVDAIRKVIHEHNQQDAS
jgi:hypothetical protein